MAKYSKRAQDKVGDVMHEMKKGTLKSGKSGKKVTSRKQAIAIGLSEARERGAKVPDKKGTTTRKVGPKKKVANKSSGRKAAPKKARSRTRKKNTGRQRGSSKKSIGRAKSRAK